MKIVRKGPVVEALRERLRQRWRVFLAGVLDGAGHGRREFPQFRDPGRQDPSLCKQLVDKFVGLRYRVLGVHLVYQAERDNDTDVGHQARTAPARARWPFAEPVAIA